MMAIDALQIQRGDNEALLLTLPGYGRVSLPLSVCRLVMWPCHAEQEPMTFQIYLHVPDALHIGPLLTRQTVHLQQLGVPWAEQNKAPAAPPAAIITAISPGRKGKAAPKNENP